MYFFIISNKFRDYNHLDVEGQNWDRMVKELVLEVFYLHQQQSTVNRQQTLFFFFFFFFYLSSNWSYSIIIVQNTWFHLPSRDDWNKETNRYKPSPHQYDFKYSCPSLCYWHHPWYSHSLRILGYDQWNIEILHRFSFHEYIVQLSGISCTAALTVKVYQQLRRHP